MLIGRSGTTLRWYAVVLRVTLATRDGLLARFVCRWERQRVWASQAAVCCRQEVTFTINVTGGGDGGSAKSDGAFGGVTQVGVGTAVGLCGGGTVEVGCGCGTVVSRCGGGTVDSRCGGGNVGCQVAAFIYSDRDWHAAEGGSSSYYCHCHNKRLVKFRC